MRTRLFRLLLSLAVIGSAAPTSAAVVAPGYVVGSIPVPDVISADVAVAGTSIFVGQGGFGAGVQSIVRRDADGTTTTVVTNLNAIGGLAYDDVSRSLYFTDNGFEQVGATTGDTVYQLVDALGATSPVDANNLKMLPNGSIPFAQAVLPFTGNDLLIGDASGPGSGRVVRLSGGVPSNFITGLDYTAGIAYTTAHDAVLVGNVDGSFVGSVKRYSLAGALLGTVASGLSGALDQALALASGNLLVTGGFTNDFSSSTVMSVTPGGSVTELAHGFGFSSGIDVDDLGQQVLVLDFGATHVDTLTAINGMTPGGLGSKDCDLEAWGNGPDRYTNGKPKPRWTCTDRDPACDRDGGANGSCTFLLGVCVGVLDLRVPKCSPLGVDTFTASSKTLPTAAADLTAAGSAIVPTTSGACSTGVEVVVPADKKTRTITLDTTLGGKRRDKDVLKLRCLPLVP
jgi:hypothetical protein